jgi:hypothetical protein
VASGGGVTGDDTWRRGLVCLKGGDLAGEIAQLLDRERSLKVERIPLEGRIEAGWVAGKEIVEVWKPSAEGSGD